jgi:hypothetical protein
VRNRICCARESSPERSISIASCARRDRRYAEERDRARHFFVLERRIVGSLKPIRKRATARLARALGNRNLN